jgi:hypothetical protein
MVSISGMESRKCRIPPVSATRANQLAERVHHLPKSFLEFFRKDCYESPTPYETMKYLLFIPLIGLALGVSSCRTFTPVDPMTGQPSARCLPENSGPQVTRSYK